MDVIDLKVPETNLDASLLSLCLAASAPACCRHCQHSEKSMNTRCTADTIYANNVNFDYR
jgi:hypothetical protein